MANLSDAIRPLGLIGPTLARSDFWPDKNSGAGGLAFTLVSLRSDQGDPEVETPREWPTSRAAPTMRIKIVRPSEDC
jgi:hypothetical protein